MKISRYPYRASAWWGSALVAQSDSCLCLDELGEPATLYFPHHDIRLELFRDEVRRISCPVKGEVEYLTIEPPAGPVRQRTGPSTASWGQSDPTSSDGDDILSRLTQPSEPFRQLSGYAAFDQAECASR